MALLCSEKPMALSRPVRLMVLLHFGNSMVLLHSGMPMILLNSGNSMVLLNPGTLFLLWVCLLDL